MGTKKVYGAEIGERRKKRSNWRIKRVRKNKGVNEVLEIIAFGNNNQ